ncbi:MAG: porin [Marinomonadaceae bacterium]
MKTILKTLAIAIASTASFASMAAETTDTTATDSATKISHTPSLDFYGKINVSLQSSDEGNGAFSELKSNASRLGFRGDLDLDEEFRVLYQAEFQLDITSENDGGKTENFKNRNQFIGLDGNFGTVLFGYNDTMLKQSEGKIDLYNDLSGDIKTLWEGENRESGSVTYVSPTVNNMHFGVSYITAGSEEGESGLSAAAIYGDPKLKDTAFYAALAVDNNIEDYDIYRGSVAAKFNVVTLGGIYQHQKSTDDDEVMDGYLVSAKFDITDALALKAQYQLADYKDDVSNSGYTVGADYQIAKTTLVYAFYTTFNFEDQSEADQKYLAVGIEQKF